MRSVSEACVEAHERVHQVIEAKALPPARPLSDPKESHNSDPNALTARNIQGMRRLFLVHFTALSGE